MEGKGARQHGRGAKLMGVRVRIMRMVVGRRNRGRMDLINRRMARGHPRVKMTLRLRWAKQDQILTRQRLMDLLIKKRSRLRKRERTRDRIMEVMLLQMAHQLKKIKTHL